MNPTTIAPLPAAQLGMAGWGCPDPRDSSPFSDFISDGFGTPEEAVAEAQRVLSIVPGVDIRFRNGSTITTAEEGESFRRTHVDSDMTEIVVRVTHVVGTAVIAYCDASGIWIKASIHDLDPA